MYIHKINTVYVLTWSSSFRATVNTECVPRRHTNTNVTRLPWLILMNKVSFSLTATVSQENDLVHIPKFRKQDRDHWMKDGGFLAERTCEASYSSEVKIHPHRETFRASTWSSLLLAMHHLTLICFFKGVLVLIKKNHDIDIQWFPWFLELGRRTKLFLEFYFSVWDTASLQGLLPFQFWEF